MVLIMNKIKPLNIKDNKYSPSLLDNLVYLKIQEKNIKNPTIEEILKINSQVRKLINEKIEVC